MQIYMTRLDFTYDLDKDVENFMRGARSKNSYSSKSTKLQQLYIDRHGASYNEDTVREFITAYTAETSFNPSEAIQKIEEGWQPIERDFFARCETIFGISYPAPKIQVYLTTNARCTYSITAGYFFVYPNAKSPNMILMHELLHFYTWEVFYAELEASGVTPERYNDVKESLTDLLNTEFADLIAGAVDEGYPQHAEMRANVRKLWLSTKDIRKTVLGALSN